MPDINLDSIYQIQLYFLLILSDGTTHPYTCTVKPYPAKKPGLIEAIEQAMAESLYRQNHGSAQIEQIACIPYDTYQAILNIIESE